MNNVYSRMITRIAVFLIITTSVISVFAQTRKAYAELIGQQKGLFSKKVKVTVDFGQNVSFWKQGDMMIVDENGKDVIFNSMVDAMNFMASNGWEFVQAYVVSESGENVYHWLMYKNVSSDEEIKAGFNVRADLKDADKDSFMLTYMKKPKKSSQWEVVKTESKRLSQNEVSKIIQDWKSQTNDNYDYDCQVQRDK